MTVTSTPPARARPTVLLVMVLVIATTGLIYELTMAAVASYLLGDSVREFSLVIGAYLSALGLGAYLSRYVDSTLARAFIDVELGAALCGGLSAPALFLAHAVSSSFSLVLYVCVALVGILVGLELPLLMRMLERRVEFKELVSRALSYDYAGALLGSLAFSFWLVPKLGLVHGSLACGLLNATVGLVASYALSEPDTARELEKARVRALLVLAILVVALFEAHRVLEFSDHASYPGRVLFARQSPYQRIVLSDSNGNLSLHLNGHLQFSSADEARYHEALVHPALALGARHAQVLIGGGGDGLAARELLKWPDVGSITLVDLDAEVTNLARSSPELSALNRHALADPRVHILNQDALRFLEQSERAFDVELFDFPDPSNYAVGKLYSTAFYRAARARLSPGGVMVVQATSPLFARAAFWCVATTLEAV
ncbi:MAG TPA: polyamine aminopropyltransferase, partial [Polyangiaceae bacterium]